LLVRALSRLLWRAGRSRPVHPLAIRSRSWLLTDPAVGRSITSELCTVRRSGRGVKVAKSKLAKL